VNENAPSYYGAYTFLEKWSSRDLTDAANAVAQLVDSPAWRALTRVFDEREAKILNQLVVTPQLEPMAMEGLRSMVNGLRQARDAPASVLEAYRRQQAELARKRGDDGDDRESG
jgi:hypothetical protein